MGNVWFCLACLGLEYLDWIIGLDWIGLHWIGVFGLEYLDWIIGLKYWIEVLD